MAKKRRNPLGFVKARPISVLGIVLMLVGFATPTVLATVHVDTRSPRPWGQWPNGNETYPTSLDPNTSYDIWVEVYDPETDVDTGSVHVVINGTSTSLSQLGTHTETVYTGIGVTKQVTVYKFGASWASPSGEAEITFNWCAKDTAGNKMSCNSYGFVGGYSKGDFYINGQKVGETSDITLNTRNLTFEFRATELPSNVDEAWIIIDGYWAKSDGKMIKSGNNWSTSWIAPNDGTYTIRGYFRSFGKSFRGMSIVIGVGESPAPPFIWEPDAFFWVGVTGIALVGIGLVTKK